MNPADTLEEARRRIGTCDDLDALKEIERELVGRKGIVASLLAEIPKLDPSERKARGQEANALKQAILGLLKERREEMMRAFAERGGRGERPADDAGCCMSEATVTVEEDEA